jgi:hypothetical protein
MKTKCRGQCDEGKPECAACVRLGICCEVRPSFEFVNGRDHTRRRTIQTRQSQTSGRRDSNTPRTLSLAEDYIVALQNFPISAQEESKHVDKDLAHAAASIFTCRAQGGVLPAGLSASDSIDPPHQLSPRAGGPDSVSEQGLSNVLEPNDTPPKSESNKSNNAQECSTRSDLVHSPSSSNESVPLLEAWFSSFVDLGVPARGSLVHDSLAGWETLKADRGDKFYELQEKLYLCHWRSHLMKMLPAPYAHVESLVEGCPALRPAIVALSAYDVAQTQTEVRSRTTELGKQCFYAPNMEHQQSGRVYYNIAKRELAEMDYGRADKVSVLATLLLFVLIESHFGLFRAAAFHHHGIEHLLSSNHGICKRSTIGRSLISVWIALRAQNWSHRIPFTLYDFQKSLLEIGIDVGWMLDSPDTRGEAVMVNMLQSWRLSLMMLFERYTGRGDMESISSRCCFDVYRRMQRSTMTQSWTSNVPIPDENYDSLLGEQRRKLDEWHAALPLSHLPIESFGSRSDAQPLSQFNPSGSCLKFQSYEAAMNYAYYVVARIVQSHEIMGEFLSMAPLVGRGHSETNSLLLILLRIIAGLELRVCARRNFYSVGLLEIVKMCHLRLPQCSAILQSLTDDLLEAFTDECITYDGWVLISNFRLDIQEIQEQRVQARDLFYIMPRFSPDANVQPNYINTSATAPTMAYGRDRATGKLFCGSFRSV